MTKFKKVFGTFLALVVVMLTLVSCSYVEPGSTHNVLSGSFKTNYLRVNDVSVVCYSDTTGGGKACNFENVTIPNGVEVTEITTELNDVETKDGYNWKLVNLVDISNNTSECLYYAGELAACNFKSSAANGSIGEEK